MTDEAQSPSQETKSPPTVVEVARASMAALSKHLSGAHTALFPRIVELLHAQGLDDVLIVAGGIIPDEDIPALNELGIHGIFGPGTSTESIVRFIHERVS